LPDAYCQRKPTGMLQCIFDAQRQQSVATFSTRRALKSLIGHG
jgi:hypothetical protein